MNILVIGGGGREHTIIKKLKENKTVEKIYALPGNGGIAADAECHPIKATDVDGIVAFATSHPIDFAVVAPDDPLVLGCVDRRACRSGDAGFVATVRIVAVLRQSRLRPEDNRISRQRTIIGDIGRNKRIHTEVHVDDTFDDVNVHLGSF